MIKKEKYLSALFAFILWGSWAFIINASDENRLLSSFFQGSASFVITIFIVELTTFLSRIFNSKSAYIVAGFTICITASFLVLGHLFIETKNILFTILPATLVAYLFSVFVVKRYRKSLNRRD